MTLSPADFTQTKPVIAIVGPTASGKTALSIEIAQQLNTEIISADSQIIYRELNIGTAKPTEEEKQGIPHWMIDVAAPDEAFNAANYKEQAITHLERLWAKQKIPIVAGGTGFYIKALLQSDFIPDVEPNPDFREKMLQLAIQNGPEYLHQLLQQKDLPRANDLHPNDQVRIIRALEIIEYTGKPVPREPKAKSHQICWLATTYEDRDLHRNKIAKRVDEMLEAGWLNEVEMLIKQYGPEAQALQVAHGYPELVEVAQGKRSLTDAREQIVINVRQYARRQRTWFHRNPEIHWLNCDKMSWFDLLKSAQTCINDMDFWRS